MDDKTWCEMLGRGDADAWKAVWDKVIVPFCKTPKYCQMLNKYSLSDGDLLGMLYEEMIGRRKLSLYRGEGSLAQYLKQYVRGFLFAANPAKHGEISLDAASKDGDEKCSTFDVPFDDKSNIRKEAWALTHICFRKLWNSDPERAYVHLLKTRFHLSSEEVRDFLDISSTANVDQIFSRNIKFMRNAWPKEG